MSEHSLQPVISTQTVQKSTEKTTRCPAQATDGPKDTQSSKKQSQDSSAQQGPLDKASQKTPSPELSLCTPSMPGRADQFSSINPAKPPGVMTAS